MQKWEYCVITNLENGSKGDLSTRYPKLIAFTDKGAQLMTDFQKRERGVSEVDMVAIIISSLGREGWELVGTGTTGANSNMHNLYFKRPID